MELNYYLLEFENENESIILATEKIVDAWDKAIAFGKTISAILDWTPLLSWSQIPHVTSEQEARDAIKPLDLMYVQITFPEEQ